MKKICLFVLVLMTPLVAYLQTDSKHLRYIQKATSSADSTVLDLFQKSGSSYWNAYFFNQNSKGFDPLVANYYAALTDSLVYFGPDTSTLKQHASGYKTQMEIIFNPNASELFYPDITDRKFLLQTNPGQVNENLLTSYHRVIKSSISCGIFITMDTINRQQEEPDTTHVRIDEEDSESLKKDLDEVVYKTEQDPECSEVVEEPVFPGGETALSRFITENTTYSPEMLDSLITGVVYVECVIEKDGSVSNIVAKKSLDDAYDREAIRVVSIMPTWKPGINICGKPARVRYVIPIGFKREY